MYTSAIVVALAGWGSLLGLGFLAIAVVAHVVSVVELIRHRSFPMFRADAAHALCGLLLLSVFYGPLLRAAYRHATPVDHAGSRFFVARDSEEHSPPTSGQWIAFRAQALGPRDAVAQILAIGGQRVEADRDGLFVDGVRVRRRISNKDDGRFYTFRFEVPEDQVLVRCLVPLPDSGRVGGMLDGLMIVDRRQITGRAWLRVSSPWDVRLLGLNDQSEADRHADRPTLASMRDWLGTCRDSSANPTLEVRRDVDRVPRRGLASASGPFKTT